MLELHPEPFDSEVSRGLVRDLLADMAARYEGEDGAGAHPRAEDFLVWLVARASGDVLGCGGICHFAEGEAELKRMYVVPSARGRGVGRLVLGELERGATALGYGRIRLETGVHQPEAIGLYTSAGYETIACWGPYANDARSVCLAKELD
jgi:GNAT superfamily N-acetyltransferase